MYLEPEFSNYIDCRRYRPNICVGNTTATFMIFPKLLNQQSVLPFPNLNGWCTVISFDIFRNCHNYIYGIAVRANSSSETTANV